jgi:hypothetical protein
VKPPRGRSATGSVHQFRARGFTQRARRERRTRQAVGFIDSRPAGFCPSDALELNCNSSVARRYSRRRQVSSFRAVRAQARTPTSLLPLRGLPRRTTRDASSKARRALRSHFGPCVKPRAPSRHSRSKTSTCGKGR